MDRHEKEQHYLLYLAGAAPGNRDHDGPIDQGDYVAVYTPPINLQALLESPCLVWRHSLTNGYGNINPNSKPARAHRGAYDQSRAEPAGDLMVLHSCNRRTCIQPAHLYAQSDEKNTQDRNDRFHQEAHPGRESTVLWNQDHDRTQDGMRYYWDEPPDLTPPYFDRDIPDHIHEYNIPVGKSLLCETCFGTKSPIGALLGLVFREETEFRRRYRENLKPFLIGRKPGDQPLKLNTGHTIQAS